MKNEIILILHNIRSTHNVGSLFRTAECAGVNKIFLTAYTPAPIDKFGRAVKEISKVALGAEKLVSWQKKTSFALVVNELKINGFKIVAIEQDERAIDYKKISVKGSKKLVFVLGNEVKGLSKKELSLCDEIAEISMKGKKESLNVSVAGAVALFRILNV